MGNMNEAKGELTSFYRILTDRTANRRPDRIVIPKIQRDYAQGRPSAKKIRERFLSSIYGAIDKESSTPIELDFVYGELARVNGDFLFMPLDGQQRLTTLFLLHWYLAKRILCRKPEEEEYRIDVRFLKLFSYENRDSSKEFCSKLVELNPVFPMEVGLDEYIKDRTWMTGTWKDDPTIASMIVMLGDIHRHYRDYSRVGLFEIWKRLVGSDMTLGNIRFYLLYIEDMGASDDLYIKMNSRGKQLTDFEHFKAEIESYLPDENSEFSKKIDAEWTNLIWEYRDESHDDNPESYDENGLDEKFLRLFRFYMVRTVLVRDADVSFKDLTSKDYLDLAETAFKDNDDDLKSFEKIMDYFVDRSKSGGIKQYFEKYLTTVICSEDKVYVGDDLVRADNSGTDYLRGCCMGFGNGNAFSISNMLILEAFFALALMDDSKRPDDPETIDRLRIIRNLISNSPDDVRYEYLPSLLRRVDLIIMEKKIEEDVHDFTILQKAQEQEKLDWLKANPSDKKSLYAVENHNMLRGNIKPVVRNNGYDVSLFAKFRKLFNDDKKLDLVERALLSIGDYGYNNRERISYGGKSAFNWRNDLFVHGNDQTPLVLVSLLDKLNNCDDAELGKIVDGFIADCESRKEYPWLFYMVKYPGARHGGSAKYTSSLNQYEHLMLNKTQTNGYHWNPFLFILSEKINGSTIQSYDSPLVLPGTVGELRSVHNGYILQVAGDSNRYFIAVEQDNGVDKENRIGKILDCIAANAACSIVDGLKSISCELVQ